MNFTSLMMIALRNNFYTELHTALYTQWLPYDKLKQLQEEKFKALINHCKVHVPYYRNLQSIDHVQSLSDIQYLPFLTKAIVREQTHGLKSDDCLEKYFIPITTSGSTGEPLDFYTDARNRVGSACTMRGDMWTGYRLGEKNICFWIIPKSAPIKDKIRRALKGLLTERTIYIDFGDLSDKYFYHLYKTINRTKPTMIVSYAVAFNLFAVYLIERGLKIHTPKGIIAGAEVLLEKHRQRIEEAFNCKVLNRYGTCEVAHIAGECKSQEGLHISMENVYLEIINESGEPCKPGELGEIVITDLNNHAFPFIRYKIGDLGILSDHSCSCGRSLPLLKNIDGRLTDITVGTNGKRMTGAFWGNLFGTRIPGVIKWQVQQHALDNIKIKLQPSKSFDRSTIDYIITYVKSALGDDIEVQVSLVDLMPLTKMGKHRWVISSINTT